jgi:hypothetical protein
MRHQIHDQVAAAIERECAEVGSLGLAGVRADTLLQIQADLRPGDLGGAARDLPGLESLDQAAGEHRMAGDGTIVLAL